MKLTTVLSRVWVVSVLMLNGGAASATPFRSTIQPALSADPSTWRPSSENVSTAPNWRWQPGPPFPRARAPIKCSHASRPAASPPHSDGVPRFRLPIVESHAKLNQVIACDNPSTRALFDQAATCVLADCLTQNTDVVSLDASANTPLQSTTSASDGPAVVRVLHPRADFQARSLCGSTPLRIDALPSAESNMADRADSTGAAAAPYIPGQSENLTILEDMVSAKAAPKAARRLRTHGSPRRPPIFDVTPFRDENRLFLNPRGIFPDGKAPSRYRYTTCSYPEYPDLSRIFPGAPHVGRMSRNRRRRRK